jgi:hypothetical protein
MRNSETIILAVETLRRIEVEVETDMRRRPDLYPDPDSEHYGNVVVERVKLVTQIYCAETVRDKLDDLYLMSRCNRESP